MYCKDCVDKPIVAEFEGIDEYTARAILDAFPYYALLVDEDHNIVLVNHLVKSYLNTPEEDIKGSFCPQLIHKMDRYPGCPLEDARDTNKHQERELYNNKTGQWVNSIIYPTLLRTKTGKKVFLHILPVITEKKRTELALKESEKRYRTLFNKGHDSVFVFKVDENNDLGALVDVNENACQLLGFDKDELIGQDKSTMGFSSVAPSLDSIFESLKVNEHLTAEAELKTRDSRSICCDLSIHLFEFSKQLTVLIIAHDLTERKHAEIERHKRYEALKKGMESMINTLAMIGEMRDIYTSGHQRRVSKIASTIAEVMGFDEERIEAIRIGALLHDIGKIVIPSEILSKPGRISEIEFEIIKAHPQVGFDILRNAEFSITIAEIVHQHHERMDGSGYPQGLIGEAINIEARIIAVADVIEAMSSRRPYREALGIDAALDEIESKKGQHFDIEVVEACKKVFADNLVQVEEDVTESAINILMY